MRSTVTVTFDCSSRWRTQDSSTSREEICHLFLIRFMNASRERENYRAWRVVEHRVTPLQFFCRKLEVQVTLTIHKRMKRKKRKEKGGPRRETPRTSGSYCIRACDRTRRRAGGNFTFFCIGGFWEGGHGANGGSCAFSSRFRESLTCYYSFFFT